MEEEKSYYYAKDHLGTIRTTINMMGETENAMDYFPYGEEIPDRSIVYGEQAKYKFTGKERDVETGYDYFGARYYDARIGRWLQVDPLADKYPGWSSYNYVLNNPMILIDPDGCDIDDTGFPTPDQDASNAFGLHLTGSEIQISTQINSEEVFKEENIHKGLQRLWSKSNSGSIWTREISGYLAFDKTIGKWKFVILNSFSNTFEYSYNPFIWKMIKGLRHAYYNGDEIFSHIHTHPTHPSYNWTGKFNDYKDNLDFLTVNTMFVPGFVMTDNNIAYVDYRINPEVYSGINRYKILGSGIRNNILTQNDAFINLTMKYSVKKP